MDKLIVGDQEFKLIEIESTSGIAKDTQIIFFDKKLFAAVSVSKPAPAREVEYEILEFRKYGSELINGVAISTLRKNGLYVNDEDKDKDGCYPLEYTLGDKEWIIHSVRRLSDGEVFLVGEPITDGFNTTTITGFQINANGQSLTILGDKGSMTLEAAKKAKQPLFTTHDGKEVYGGDEVFCVDEEYHMFPTAPTKKFEEYKYFSTEKAAIDFIELNKPILSLQDIHNYIAHDAYINHVGNIVISIEGITSLVRKRLYADK